MVSTTTKRIMAPDSVRGVPELLDFIAQDDIQVELRKLNKHAEKQELIGKIATPVLLVTEQEQCYSFIANYPNLTLASASLINDGPGSAFIGINGNAERFEIKPGGAAYVDRKGAEERIALIYYQCPPGETTTVRVNGTG